jgi:hypothetical protein
MIPFDDVVQSLTKKFGNSIVRCSDVIDHIEKIGEKPHRFMADLRDKFSIAHGKMLFADKEQQQEKTLIQVINSEETDFQIQQRIGKRFNALDVMARATAKGINRSLIVSGPPGLGKSFGIERAAEEIVGDFTHVKGYIRPTGLYKTLYENRFPSNLIVFDDIDSLFSDETSLNLLKAACDSSDVRRLSWLSNSVMEDDDGEEIPKNFEFEGSIIFITNIDFEAQIEKATKLAPHFDALMSRSHYLSLDIKNKRDYIVRIKQVLNAGMLDILSKEEKEEIVSFMEQNIAKMRELSLRMAKKLADLMLMDKTTWKDLASMTCMKQ